MSDPTLAEPREEEHASKSNRQDLPVGAEALGCEADPVPARGERGQAAPGETTDRVAPPDPSTDADSAGGPRPPTLDSTDALGEPASGAFGGESTWPGDAPEPGSAEPHSPGSIDPDAPLAEDDFRLLDSLGSGGMGEVHRAFQKSLRKQVALKLLKREALDSPGRVRRFLAEARALARLKHPQVVGVHGIGRMGDGRYFLVMDLIEGGATLQGLIKDGPVAVDRAAGLVAGIAWAIEHAHGRGVIHRDLKPSNVLLDGDGEPHVTDFGLAKIFDAIDPEHPQTTADQILGTPHYMSPEQADPARGPATPRTDVYGLGGILFALLTGRPPLEGDSITQILGQLVSPGPVRSPRSLRPELPPGLDEICRKCLHKEAGQRYRSAGEVARALQEWLARHPQDERDFGEDRVAAPRPVADRGGWSTDRSLKDGAQRRTGDRWLTRGSPASRSRLGRVVKLSTAFAVLIGLLMVGSNYSRRRESLRTDELDVAAKIAPPLYAPPVDFEKTGEEVVAGSHAPKASPGPGTVLAMSPGSPVGGGSPDLARVCFRASPEVARQFGAGAGSIAIVLDCSGSMLDQTQAGRTKFDEAQVALGEVLRSVPPETKLSLWTFSQLPDGVNQIFVGNPLVEEPELSIRPLLPMAPWDPRRTDEVIGRIRQLRPYLETPLVQAMWTAAGRDLKDATGLKTLLVLTDGDDNQLEKFKPNYNPSRLSTRDFIVSGFKPMGITVNMVFFSAAGKSDEVRKAAERFRPALAQLDPPGSFYEANSVGELTEALKRGAAQHLTCQIVRPDGTPVVVRQRVGPPGGQEIWSEDVEPGRYALRVVGLQSSEQFVDLGRGQRIVAELDQVAQGKVGLRLAQLVQWDLVPGPDAPSSGTSRAGARRDFPPMRLVLEIPMERESGSGTLQVRARLHAPPDSGIREAAFLAGSQADLARAAAEGRMVPGEPRGGAWLATIPIPRDLPGQPSFAVHIEGPGFGGGLSAASAPLSMIGD
ncbi:MAG: protein kinase [Isosphaeraceae bacterium]